ncbi:hypothetical protein PanWU01x14_134330 [Parasponia andersonii]|uniref:Protein EARLY FLOWERING 4 domain-containing protein n=1 Tax=Parasponia andersonii TaxID=3476 RepID=A0A2P5CPQ3_PARAD|nr:hypothetical protein PanWU01x14_134330 [Parasponia andersonii]
MSRVESWRPVEESTMDDAIKTSKNKKKKKNKKKSKRRLNGEAKEEEDGEEEEKCDDEAWDTLSRGFKQAQSVLDQNRELIQQVNDNHRSNVPDNLAENVSLIRQINGNISKVISIYSDLSVNFSAIVHQRRELDTAAKKGEEEEDEDKHKHKDEN